MSFELRRTLTISNGYLSSNVARTLSPFTRISTLSIWVMDNPNLTFGSWSIARSLRRLSLKMNVRFWTMLETMSPRNGLELISLEELRLQEPFDWETALMDCKKHLFDLTVRCFVSVLNRFSEFNNALRDESMFCFEPAQSFSFYRCLSHVIMTYSHSKKLRYMTLLSPISCHLRDMNVR